MLTRFGVRILISAVLALLGAATSGANLLYLIDGMLWSVLVAAWWWSGRNVGRISARAVFPEQVFADTEFPLTLCLKREKGGAAHLLKIRSPGEASPAPLVPRRGESEVSIKASIPRRGLNEIGDIWVESDYPFGLFRRRRRITGLVGLVYPAVFEIYGRQASPAVRAEEISLPRRGAGEEFYGLRDYADGEDARLINWKLTAKTGKPLVKEYAEQVGNRITVTVEEAEGPEAERRISEAASLAKYFIDAGADVRLKTPEATVAYGHGLIHLGLIFKTLALLGRGKTIERFEKPLPKAKDPAFPDEGRLSPFAYLTALIAFVSLFLIEELNPLPLLGFLVFFPLGWICNRKNRYPLPRIVFDILASAYLLFFLFVDLPWSGSLRAVTRLILFILLYLLFIPKTGRVPAQILTTSFLIFFLVSGQALSLWYFIFFLAFFAAMGAWLIDRRDPRPRPRKAAWGGSLAAILGTAVILAAMAFVVLPRPYSARMQQLLASTGLTRFQGSARSFSGLAEQVDLGYLGPIHKNTARVMRVTVEGAEGDSQPESLRVRGAAFDHFDGRRWKKSRVDFAYQAPGGGTVQTRRTMAWMRRDRRVIVSPAAGTDTPVRAASFDVFPLLNTSLVFFTETPASIETVFRGAWFDFTDTVYFPGAYPEGTRYRVLSHRREPDLWRVIENYQEILRTYYLQTPGPNDRLRRLAEDFTARASGDAETAAAVESRLREGYTYSLAANLGRQDINGFLFDSRAGNCEYFATAMVLMLRTLGIPARLAVGFLSSDWNAYGNFYDVRQSDAHAWVEAYLPENGWTTFDPTPPDFTRKGRQNILARIWSGLNRQFEELQFRWYRYVVGFDKDTQKNFLYTLVLKIGVSLVPLLIGILVLSLAVFLAFKVRSRGPAEAAWRPSRRKPGDFYESLLQRLGRAGFPRRPSQTAAEYARELGAAHPEVKALARLAEHHYEIKYAKRRLTEREHAEILRMSKDIAAAARRIKRRRR